MDWRLGPLILGVVCVAAFAGAAGGVEAPVVDVGSSYDVTVEPVELLTIPEAEGGGGEAPSSLEVAGLDVEAGGPAGWLSVGWAVVVLGLWILVAMRTMNAGSALGAIVFGAVVLGLVLLVGMGGSRPEAAGSTSQQVGLLGQIVFVLLGLVTVLSGVVLLLPDDADAYAADRDPLGFLRAVAVDVSRRVRRRLRASDDAATLEPDNPVYDAWLDVARRHGGADRTPGEVDRAARDAGVPVEPLRDLRQAFEQVRYGGVEPSDERVERARSARERVEEHDRAGEGSEGGTG